MPKTMRGQRLLRSSRSPELRLTGLNRPTTTSPMVATEIAVRAGTAKKAANPPRPQMASPR